MTLEERLRDSLKAADRVAPPASLPGAVMREVRPRGRASGGLLTAAALGSVLLLVAVVGGLAVLGSNRANVPMHRVERTAVASPAPSSAPPPTAAALKPYRVIDSKAPGGSRLISSPADCEPLPSDWLRQLCSLVLRPTWQSIVAPTDPSPGSASWYAALARAEIDGDLSICEDIRMRTWMSIAPQGGAPAPGTTTPPRHPIQDCRQDLAHPPKPGTVDITDPTQSFASSLIFTFDPPVMVVPPPPSTDPTVACQTMGNPPTIEAPACQQILDAVLGQLGSDATVLVGISIRPTAIPCDAAGTACPPPPGGTLIGSALAGLGPGRTLTFNAWDVGGQVVLVPVADPNATPSPSPAPTASAAALAPDEFPIPTGDGGGDALLTGMLGGDAVRDGGCLWLQQGTTRSSVMWPYGFRAFGRPIRLEGPDGRVIAREGDRLELGGGAPPLDYVIPVDQDPCGLGSVLSVGEIGSVNGVRPSIGTGPLALLTRGPASAAGPCDGESIPDAAITEHLGRAALRLVGSNDYLEALWPAGFTARVRTAAGPIIEILDANGSVIARSTPAVEQFDRFAGTVAGNRASICQINGTAYP